MFLDAHFEAVGPSAPQLCVAHPRNALEERTHRLHIHGKKSAPHPSLKSADDVAAFHAVEVAADDDRLEQESGRIEEHSPSCVQEERERKRCEKTRCGVRKARVIPHDRPPPRAAPIPKSGGTDLRMTA